jgi:hypothetical protein
MKTAEIIVTFFMSAGGLFARRKGRPLCVNALYGATGISRYSLNLPQYQELSHGKNRRFVCRSLYRFVADFLSRKTQRKGEFPCTTKINIMAPGEGIRAAPGVAAVIDHISIVL